jgi:hypothetical protein
MKDRIKNFREHKKHRFKSRNQMALLQAPNLLCVDEAASQLFIIVFVHANLLGGRMKSKTEKRVSLKS